MPEERGWLGDYWAFSKYFYSGVWDAAAGTVEGVVELAKGGYALATDEKARESAWNTTKKLAKAAGDYGEEVWDDPAKAYRDARDGTLAAYNTFEQAKEKAAAEGSSAEFWGDLTGKVGFEIGTIIFGVGVAAKAGKLGKVASSAGRRVKAVAIKGASKVGSAAQRARRVVVDAKKVKDCLVTPVGKCPRLKKAAKIADEVKKKALISELSEQGIKHTPENIIDIAKTSEGKIVFLETGNNSAGLQHIVKEHRDDFLNRGISEDQISDAVMTAITEGKVVGHQGKGRPIYEFQFNGQTQRIAVTTSNNGFIVGANPN